MEIMSCHGFVNNNKATTIFSCRSKLFSHFLSKYFVTIHKNPSAFKYVILHVKQLINPEDLHKDYFKWRATEQYLLLLIT